MSLPRERYLTRDYYLKNPTWDAGDAPWKAERISRILRGYTAPPSSICEVGCGSGAVLAELRGLYPEAELFGYDIAPAAAAFWAGHTDKRIQFRVGDFFELNDRHYDLVLLLDVLEHLENPFLFLVNMRRTADLFLFHIPLDLSAVNILRETRILLQRERVGHIHYFTRNLALSLLRDGGYEILHWRYSGAAFHSPQRTAKTKAAAVVRFIFYALNKEFGVRALGGETVFVLARSQ